MAFRSFGAGSNVYRVDVIIVRLACDMFYKIVADFIVAVHCGWIVFMLWGFATTAWGMFKVYVLRRGQKRWGRFFDRWVLRCVHLGGILYVGMLTMMREYCPLTIWENVLRSKYDPTVTYPGSFIIYYVERFVYPDVHPLLLIIGTLIIGGGSLAMFIIRPPAKIWRWRRRRSGGDVECS